LVSETAPDIKFEINIIPDAGHEFVGELESAALVELLGA
jgi:hypothetical protein